MEAHGVLSDDHDAHTKMLDLLHPSDNEDFFRGLAGWSASGAIDRAKDRGSGRSPTPRLA
jgi:hypothetical protein